MTTIANRKIVLGLGNTLQTDEGLGVFALQALADHLGEQDQVELLDGGVLGLNLLPLVEESSHLLILDAADAQKPPGAIIELPKEDIPLYAGVKMSQHQLTFQEVLGLALIREKLPEHLYLIGVQPADLTVGYGLSETITAVIPEVIARATAVLQGWSLL